MVLLGNPENRRTLALREAVMAVSGRCAEVLPWLDLIRDPPRLAAVLAGGALLRIDSPGENYQVWRELVELGAQTPIVEARLADEPGRVRFRAEWFAGFKQVLDRIGTEVHDDRQAGNTPQAIAACFDKLSTHRRLLVAGLPRPEVLAVGAAEDLLTTMAETPRWRQVFLKPRHGSSSSGVIALRRHPDGRVCARSSLYLSPRNGHAYNCLKVRRYEEPDVVRRLLEHAFAEPVIVERWLPKRSFQGMTMDLRVATCGDQSRHVVVRGSHSPLTNLHLGGSRLSLQGFRQGIGRVAFDQILDLAVAATRAMGCAHAGVDILLDQSNRPFVLEVNAFGDLLPGVESAGRDTYRTQVQRLIGR